MGQDGEWVDYGILMGYMMRYVTYFFMAVNG